jgi:DNA-binding Lrp family transcriptional regulator
MRLVDRDKQILKKLEICKWLTTSQIQRLYFPHASLDAVRKRLRKLGAAGYIRSYQPDRMSEALHGLGAVPKQVDHLVAINTIRIHAEQAGAEFFYANWELGSFDWNYAVIPDAILKTDSVYLIEYDSGTESLQQFKDKLRLYATSLDFEYTLVIAANTDRRLTQLKKVANALIGGKVLTQLLIAFR